MWRIRATHPQYMLPSANRYTAHLLLLCSRHQEDATMAAKTVRDILDGNYEEQDHADQRGFDDPAGVTTPTPDVACGFRVRTIAAVGGDHSSIEEPMLSLLSLDSEGEDADAEPSEDENDASKSSGGGGSNRHHRLRLDYSDKSYSFSGRSTSPMPGTPGRILEAWAKDYASETEARGCAGGRRRHGQEARWRTRVDRMWEQRKSQAVEEDEADAPSCRVLVRSGLGGSNRSICMDMEEMRACRDLGLQLPGDWTLEIPGAISVADTSSGGTSPIANWRISSPGEDPKDVKARLKLWAQAVALASASRLGV